MWLVVGLGNHGKSYDGARHNAGWDLLASLVKHYDLQPMGTKFHGELWKGNIGTVPVLGITPRTFMNRSGRAVSAAATFYKIPPEHIIVLHDDLDLSLGKLRIKQGGGHGGHNGLRDIDSMCGTHYWRVRLGIGRPQAAMNVSDYVLQRFTSDEQMVMEGLYQRITLHFPLMLENAPDKLMSAVALDG